MDGLAESDETISAAIQKPLAGLGFRLRECVQEMAHGNPVLYVLAECPCGETDIESSAVFPGETMHDVVDTLIERFRAHRQRDKRDGIWT